MSDQQFSKEELESILKNAAKKQQEKHNSFSEDEIVEAAKELGIDEQTIRNEVKNLQLNKELESKEAESKSRKTGFFVHLAIFILVNLFLRGVGFHFPGPPIMKMFPFFPWIIFLVFHGVSVFGCGQIGCKNR